ncbi:hypothetical protein BC834DRAFT_230328 [Gloeopeniophorella convolvens]|nr:hypothetical protein BC834DRAFT_230328 [Gloeopeniophorella convolvens]
MYLPLCGAGPLSWVVASSFLLPCRVICSLGVHGSPSRGPIVGARASISVFCGAAAQLTAFPNAVAAPEIPSSLAIFGRINDAALFLAENRALTTGVSRSHLPSPVHQYSWNWPHRLSLSATRRRAGSEKKVYIITIAADRVWGVLDLSFFPLTPNVVCASSNLALLCPFDISRVIYDVRYVHEGQVPIVCQLQCACKAQGRHAQFIFVSMSNTSTAARVGTGHGGDDPLASIVFISVAPMNTFMISQKLLHRTPPVGTVVNAIPVGTEDASQARARGR